MNSHLSIVNHPDAQNLGLVGSDREKWKKEKISSSVENLPRLTAGEPMVSIHEIAKNISRCDVPIVLDPKTASFDDVAIYALKRDRKAWGTVNRRLRAARRMETHPVIPVDFRDPNYIDFVRYMDYREEIEEAGPGALRQDWQAMTMFLKAYGIPWGDKQIWHYKPPSAPERPKSIFTPLQAYKLIHARYKHRDPVISKMTNYLLMSNLLIGWRVPTEPSLFKISDINWDLGILTITESKKGFRQREIGIEESYLISRYRLSLKNWIDIWRPRIESQYSGDFVFIDDQGRPFAGLTDSGHEKKERLRMLLNRTVKEKFPWYYNYGSRHWGATARLIQQEVIEHCWNIEAVQLFLGHESPRKTKGYVHKATLMYRRYPFDWISHILRRSKKAGGECDRSNRRKSNRPDFGGSINSIPSCRGKRRLPGANSSTGENHFDRILEMATINGPSLHLISPHHKGGFAA